jgi:hypothetical protein
MTEIEQIFKHLETVTTKQDLFTIKGMVFVVWQN